VLAPIDMNGFCIVDISNTFTPFVKLVGDECTQVRLESNDGLEFHLLDGIGSRDVASIGSVLAADVAHINKLYFGRECNEPLRTTNMFVEGWDIIAAVNRQIV
jgi:hypothetical protein